MRIQQAYEVLSDPHKRQKYEAGLALQASLTDPPTQRNDHGYQPPLRCGLILANGVERLGRLVVESILGWEDICSADGEILVTSWPKDADHFVEKWVDL